MGEARVDGARIEIPGYTVGERIGSGGFGEVLRARHDAIDRDVAIKVLHARYSTHPEAVARFISEARAVGRLSHPGIVDVYDFGELADGRQYCVMELLRGRTLRDVLRTRTRLPLDAALPILCGIAEAIDATHAAGIAHRDLKPDNVFVLDAGGVKLIDFGLAKLAHDDPATPPMTETGAVFGTPLYMSPEQCRGKGVDVRTDAYSFGALAYQVLTGEPPFDGDALQLALHHLKDAPDAPSTRCSELSPRVDEVLLALLAKDPADRPAPLAAAVARLAGDATVPRRRSRRRAPLLIGAIALVSAIGVVGWRLARTETAQPHVGPRTIAVLGFANRGDAEHAWIGTGLVQMLGPALRAGGAVRVPSVTSVDEVLVELGIVPTDAPSHEDMERIRAAFSPDDVVVGWFRPHGGMIDITARLVDTSRTAIAEAREDVPETELPQAAIRIVNQLRDAVGAGVLDPAAAAEARKLWPVRVEAMQHYALELAAELHEDHPTAIAEATRAIAVEPDFAPAHDVLAGAYDAILDARASDEFEQAHRLADGLPENERLWIEARYKSQLLQVDAAARLWRRILELDPQDLVAGVAAAYTLAYGGIRPFPDEARLLVARLRGLPPPASSDPNLDQLEGLMVGFQGHFDRCVTLETRSEAAALRSRRPSMVIESRLNSMECPKNLGKLDEAIALVDDTLSRPSAAGPKVLVMGFKCGVLRRRGDLGAAERMCRDVVAAIQPNMNAEVAREAEVRLADVLVAESKLDDAKAALASAEHACKGARPACNLDQRSEANLHAALGEPDAQRTTLVAMLDATHATHDLAATEWAARALGEADFFQLRAGDECIAELQEAIAIADAHPDLFLDDERADNYRMLRRILGARGRITEALAVGRRQSISYAPAATTHPCSLGGFRRSCSSTRGGSRRPSPSRAR